MECNHRFEGHADGVTCQLCGLRMTADEYAAYLNIPAEQNPAGRPKKPKKKREEPTHE